MASSSVCAPIIMRRLLKSWAIPPASWPTASIFWVCSSCFSNSFWRDTSRAHDTTFPGSSVAARPTSTGMRLPSFLMFSFSKGGHHPVSFMRATACWLSSRCSGAVRFFQFMFTLFRSSRVYPNIRRYASFASSSKSDCSSQTAMPTNSDSDNLLRYAWLLGVCLSNSLQEPPTDLSALWR